MVQLIDKAAVVEEIEKRIKEIDEIGTYLSPKGTLTNLLCFLNALDVKEVDLEKEHSGMIISNQGMNIIKKMNKLWHNT